jgi:hypothetical protein
MSIKMEIQGVAELNKALEQLMGNKMPGLKVGVLENAKDPEGEPIAPRAFYNEFGTAHIPPRPAFRLTIEEKSAAWANGLVSKLKDGNIFDEAKVEAAVKLLAETMKSDLMRKIGSGVAPASAASTVRRKQSLGKAAPYLTLVEDGDYQKSIDYEIIPAGQKK